MGQAKIYWELENYSMVEPGQQLDKNASPYTALGINNWEKSMEACGTQVTFVCNSARSLTA